MNMNNTLPTRKIKLRFPCPINQTDSNEIEIQIDVTNQPIISEEAFKLASESIGPRKSEELCISLSNEFNRQVILQQVT